MWFRLTNGTSYQAEFSARTLSEFQQALSGVWKRRPQGKWEAVKLPCLYLQVRPTRASNSDPNPWISLHYPERWEYTITNPTTEAWAAWQTARRAEAMASVCKARRAQTKRFLQGE